MSDKLVLYKPRSTGAYVKALFHNVYNYSLLGGVATAAALTGQWWLLAMGAGAEALYMLWAPSSKFVRGKVDGMFAAEDQKEAAAHREKILELLSSRDRNRASALIDKEAEIRELAENNKSLERSLLDRELQKLGQLVNDFVSLCEASSRLRAYLDNQDKGELERKMRHWEAVLEGDKRSERELARRNLDVLKRRMERLRDIQTFVERAVGEMSLIENSFGLLSDQIVSMQSAGEFAGQLDDLLDGVDAVRSAAGVAERLSQEVL
ncbi:MAG: hypothetical protein ABIJ09_03635 [Pseudomonadota bacterium]